MEEKGQEMDKLQLELKDKEVENRIAGKKGDQLVSVCLFVSCCFLFSLTIIVCLFCFSLKFVLLLLLLLLLFLGFILFCLFAFGFVLLFICLFVLFCFLFLFFCFVCLGLLFILRRAESRGMMHCLRRDLSLRAQLDIF